MLLYWSILSLVQTLSTVWHEILVGSNFGDFSSHPLINNKFLQLKITTNIFPTKIYSTENSL